MACPPPSVNAGQPGTRDFQKKGYGAWDCFNRTRDYLKDGILPPNGYTCPINGPAAGSLSLRIAKEVPPC